MVENLVKLALTGLHFYWLNKMHPANSVNCKTKRQPKTKLLPHAKNICSSFN